MQIVYTVSIQSNPSISPTITLLSIAQNGAVNVNARFVQLLSTGSYDDPNSTASANSELSTPTPIQQIFNSPSLAPVSFGVTPTNKGLIVDWDDTVSVQYTPNPPAIDQVPPQVLMMVFDNTVTTAALNAKDASATATYNANATCSYTAPTVSGSPCISCTTPGANGTWITDTMPTNIPGIKYFGLVPNMSPFVVPNLQPDIQYTVVIQYVQGILQSNCIEATPYQNKTLTELNGGDDSKQGDPRCFIVSAAFGSPFHRHVDIFRWARDSFLEPFSLGHEFVDFYYEHSQPFADLVKSSPVLQTLVRTALYPIAFVLYAIQEGTEYPILSLSIIAFVVLFCC